MTPPSFTYPSSEEKVSSCPSMKGGEKTVSVCCATLVSHTFLLCYCLDGRPIRRGKRAISGIPGFTAQKGENCCRCHVLRRRRRQQVIQLAQKKCRLKRCSFTFPNFCAFGFPIKSSFIKKSPLSLFPSSLEEPEKCRLRSP